MIPIPTVLASLDSKPFEKEIIKLLQQIAGGSTKYNGLGFRFGAISGQTIQLLPIQESTLISEYNIEINGVNYQPTPAPINLSLATTGLGGLVDGLDYEPGRKYLIWAIANDANTAFTGVVITRKPDNFFQNIQDGGGGPTALKGTTSKFFTNSLPPVGNTANLYTVDAKIKITTTNNPTNGVGEWNWGTIVSIDPLGDAINVLMDNDPSYGFDITNVGVIGANSSEMQQQNMFQPWVVGFNSHALYANNFRLLGELYTQVDGSFNIYLAYKTDDEFRLLDVHNLPNTKIWEVTANTNTVVSLANLIPLWADQASVQISHTSANAGDFTIIQPADQSTTLVQLITQVGGQSNVGGNGFIPLYPNALIYAQTIIAAAGNSVIQCIAFRVAGGMLL